MMDMQSQALKNLTAHRQYQKPHPLPLETSWRRDLINEAPTEIDFRTIRRGASIPKFEELERTCFVIMPFGKKRVGENGGRF